MLRSCCDRCFDRRSGDGLLWHVDLKPHAAGEFSMAVVQANSVLEDQSQVYASPSATYVGVYDGHGGPEASRFVCRHLFSYLHKFVKEREGLSPEVIKKAFAATEDGFTDLVKRSLLTKPNFATVGSCCLLGSISNGELCVANSGDSRAVLGRRGFDGEKKVVAERLSMDHNVADENVRREVEALNSDEHPVVTYHRGAWRIMGIIQVSRSIGDIYLKKPDFHRDPKFQHVNFVPMKRPLLTAEPSIVTRKIRPQDLFVIFASDGLWEQLSDEEAVQIVSKYPRAGIAKRLVEAALNEVAKKREVRYRDIKKIERGVRRHFHDDITVIVVYLDHHNSTNPKLTTTDCTTAPVDIFSHHNSDEAMDSSSVDKIFPKETLPAEWSLSSARRIMLR